MRSVQRKRQTNERPTAAWHIRRSFADGLRRDQRGLHEGSPTRCGASLIFRMGFASFEAFGTHQLAKECISMMTLTLACLTPARCALTSQVILELELEIMFSIPLCDTDGGRLCEKSEGHERKASGKSACFSSCRSSPSVTEPVVLLACCCPRGVTFSSESRNRRLVALVVAGIGNRSSYLTQSRPPPGTGDQFVWISRDDRSRLVEDALGEVGVFLSGRERVKFRGPVHAKTSTQDDTDVVRRLNRVQ